MVCLVKPEVLHHDFIIVPPVYGVDLIPPRERKARGRVDPADDAPGHFYANND